MREFFSRINWLELKRVVWQKFKNYLLFTLIVLLVFLYGLYKGIMFTLVTQAIDDEPKKEDSTYYNHQPLKLDNIKWNLKKVIESDTRAVGVHSKTPREL